MSAVLVDFEVIEHHSCGNCHNQETARPTTIVDYDTLSKCIYERASSTTEIGQLRTDLCCPPTSSPLLLLCSNKSHMPHAMRRRWHAYFDQVYLVRPALDPPVGWPACLCIRQSP